MAPWCCVPALAWGWSNRIAGLLADQSIVRTYQPIVDMRTGVLWCEVYASCVTVRMAAGSWYCWPLSCAIWCWELDRVVVTVPCGNWCTTFPRGTLNISFSFFPKNIDPRRAPRADRGQLQRAGHAGYRFDIEVTEQGDQSALSNQIAELSGPATWARLMISARAIDWRASGAGADLPEDRQVLRLRNGGRQRASLIPEIVAIARAVGRTAIAEGIENEAQRVKLLEFGVDYGQGYLYAPPMEIEALVRYLEGAPGQVPEARQDRLD